MVRYQMFVGAALLVGVAIGYFVKDEPVAAEPPQAVERARNPIADKGEGASIGALRRRIAELEKALAVRGEDAEIAISNAVAEAQARLVEQPRGNWRAHMEEMKKNEPERYAQMTNRMARFRQSRAVEAQGKIGFLSSIDTSRMSAKARKTHVALQELIVRREAIEQQLQSAELSDEDRSELMGELRTTHRELMRLNDEERSNLFAETVRNLGFEGDDAREISATFHEILRATDGGFGPPRGHRDGGPRGPGGPGGR